MRNCKCEYSLENSEYWLSNFKINLRKKFKSSAPGCIHWYSVLLSELGNKFKNNLKILDYGCGNGGLLSFIARKIDNFKYYGLTDFKPDFWFELPDGTYKKHSRGPTKGFKGIWLPRPRKHRYLMVYDKKLKTSWIEEPYPKGNNINYYGSEE